MQSAKGHVRGGDVLISIVVPVFNEEDSVSLFVDAIAVHMPSARTGYEILFVNDGSRDGTLLALSRLRAVDRRVRIIDLSRNFGKEAAMTAGLEAARGDAAIIMDVDLQDPPEILGEMIRRWREGFDVVNARRISRATDSTLKRATAAMFYRWFNSMTDAKIPSDVGDFRLIDRKVIDALNRLPERVRFMKGLFAWVGFRSATVDFLRCERRAGTSKFNYWRLWNFALDGITSFSTVPLRIWTYFGIAVAGLSFLYGAAIVARTLMFGINVPGYASTLTAVLFLGGVQLMGLGVIGEYLGRVYIEVKRRPTHIVASVDEDGDDSDAERRPAAAAVP